MSVAPSPAAPPPPPAAGPRPLFLVGLVLVYWSLVALPHAVGLGWAGTGWLFGFIALGLYGLPRRLGLDPPDRYPVVLIPFVAYGFVTYAGHRPFDMWAVAEALLWVVPAELVFRGAMIGALWERGIARAVVLSALLYGTAHIYVAAIGHSLAQTLVTCGIAACYGLFYGALRAVMRSVWPGTLLYTLFTYLAWNTRGDRFDSGDVVVGVTVEDVLAAVVFAAFGWFYLRADLRRRAG